MHTKPVGESSGKLSEPLICEIKCPKCRNKRGNTYRDSECGVYEDTRHTCASCGHVWWREGPDS